METAATTLFTLTLLFSSGAATLMAIPAWSLLLLTLASMKRTLSTETVDCEEAPVRVAIVVPAHNESFHILPTLQCLQAQTANGDRLLVIADNCEDDTASVARRAGVEVLERNNPLLRGKGYALAYGVDALRNDPPDVLIVVDADCTVSVGGIHAMALRCKQSNCPVQMLDLMVAPPGAGLRTRMLEFAWLIKNKVRPMGSFRLGRTCHLMGTGMALPWEMASHAQFATDHIAEDMKLGVDMAMGGHPTLFLAQAQVTSEFPDNTAVARTQKTRWEHGHLKTLHEELPRLLSHLVRKPSKSILVLAMDLAIPPLAMYFLCLGLLVPLLALGSLISASLTPALTIALTAAASLLTAVLFAWLQHGRRLLSLSDLMTAPFYALWKLPIYVAYFLQHKSGWIKTARKV
jgi:cellulose synthase/poly-beta-1,6-N-acetylglucosamine synthase-like glycosyltransferase